MNPRFLPQVAVARSVLRTQSDARLTELARAGSEPAFEAIVARYRRSLERSCARVVGEADAEEATQDALLKAYAALRRGDPVRRLAPWLHVIAHHTALSYLRARAARPHVVDLDCECGVTIDGAAEYREELGEVLEAVRLLPDRQRSAIVMRELEGRSYDEIALRLGSSNGAVRQLLNRARHSVRERVGALVPVGLLLRLGLVGAGGGEAAGGATLSGACVLGAKACVAALVPATVALVASAPGPQHSPTSRHARAAAAITSAPRAGNGSALPATASPVSYAGAAIRLATGAHANSTRPGTAAARIGVIGGLSSERGALPRQHANPEGRGTDAPAQPAASNQVSASTGLPAPNAAGGSTGSTATNPGGGSSGRAASNPAGGPAPSAGANVGTGSTGSAGSNQSGASTGTAASDQSAASGGSAAPNQSGASTGTGASTERAGQRESASPASGAGADPAMAW